MISNIHSTTIVVADQDKALDFYVNTLGWSKSLDVAMGDMRFVTVVPPGAVTELALMTEGSAPGTAKPGGGDTGISLTTPDIEETYKTLSERGVKFKGPIEVMPWGDKAAWFYDIDGNGFFLDQPSQP